MSDDLRVYSDNEIEKEHSRRSRISERQSHIRLRARADDERLWCDGCRDACDAKKVAYIGGKIYICHDCVKYVLGLFEDREHE